ncbi:Protein turtle [Gryllus bimaculatus]|nr:Protein turtle [Gryllus bimaculatus]
MDIGMHNERMAILPNGSLFIESVNQEDQGQYICEARNGIGAGLSAVVDLVVHAPVHFKVRSRKEMVRRRGSAVLRCQALGDMPITFAWRKEGSFRDLQGRDSVKNISGGLESDFRIDDVNVEDGGIYTCFARNGYGQDQTTIHLLVQDAPEHPTNLRVLDQSSRRVTIAWAPAQDGNSPITRYLVRYNKIKNAWAGPILETVVEGGQSSALLAGLQPATTYSVRVLAENTLGPGAASNELLVRTAEEAPSAAPLRLSADARSSTQVALAFDPPPPDAWNGPLLGHYVGHRLLGDSDKRKYNFTTVQFHGTGRQETLLNDLRKFCKYGLVVQAFNSKGSGPLSDEVIAQTLEDELPTLRQTVRGRISSFHWTVPEASPRDVRCTALSPESLQISWQPPPETLVHGVINGYRLLYEPVAPQPQDESIEPATRVTTALMSVLHNLLKYTNYSVELLAYTSVGDGVKSPKTYCRTKEDVPGPPAQHQGGASAADAGLGGVRLPAGAAQRLLLQIPRVRMRAGSGGARGRALRVCTPATAPDCSSSCPGAAAPAALRLLGDGPSNQVGEGKSTPVAAVTPAAKVSASIVSFGGVQEAAWRSDVRLPCEAVGIPEPSRRWQRPGDLSMSQQPRAHVLPDGALLLSNVQRPDQGEYMCQVSNDHGSDHITYRLVVLDKILRQPQANVVRKAQPSDVRSILDCGLEWEMVNETGQHFYGGRKNLGNEIGCEKVPPGAPVLLMTGGTQHSLQLQWKLGDTGGSRVRSFVLHYKHEHGEWEELQLDGGRSTHVLTGLRCGTQYHVFITALNGVGTGDPSPTLNVRTRGAVPLRPQHAELIAVNSSSVTLNLNAWPDGGCPLFYFVVEYSQYVSDREDNWIVVGNNIGTDRSYPLGGLNPGQNYKIRVTAHNAAGSTVAQYKVKTLSEFGGTVSPSHVITRTEQKTPLHKDMKIVVVGVLSSVKSEYRRPKRGRPCEEYDSFGSESDTEPGTSSRTESSNQLDSGGMVGDLGRYHHSAARLSKIGMESMYPEPEWTPPMEIASGTERRPFVRKYCQAHHMK